MSNTRVIYTSLLLLLSNISAFNTVAQETAWKRQVAREIEIGGMVDDRMRTKEDSLLELLCRAIQKRELRAYADIENNFRAPSTSEYVNNLLRLTADTIAMIDPVTGKEVIKIIKQDENKVHQYRILEEWTFNRKNGETNIKIIGIAPLTDVYGEDFDAKKVLFWVKYEDVASILSKQWKEHPDKAFLRVLLTDCFGSDISKIQFPFTNIWVGRKYRTLDLDPIDSQVHHLKSLSSDSSLTDLISNKIGNRTLNIYDSTGKQIPQSTIYPPADTIFLIDPVSGQEVMKTIKHSLLFYGHDPKYKLAEDWEFNIMNGNTQINISFIAPFGKNSNDYDNRFPAFTYWLKFKDISFIIAKYEYTHFNNSLSNALWNNYFLEDQVIAKKK